MTTHDVLVVLAFCAILIVLAYPLGLYMAAVYSGQSRVVKAGAKLERAIYRLCGTREDEEMTFERYALAVLVFNVAGLAVVYGLQRLQGSLPLNPEGLGAVSPEVSFSTAVSFASNTNWQAYGGETTMSYFTQMMALTVQNFVSAATGMAVLVALMRGFTRKENAHLGSFWVDLTRSTLYVLLPLSVVFAVVLVSQGVVQTFAAYVHVPLVDSIASEAGDVTEQILAVGPAASQIAIKQLGTNGGGFFNVNSAHPFENPTVLSNLLEVLAILLVPAALCFTFGAFVKDHKQGVVLLGAMFAIFLPLALGTVWAEQAGNPALDVVGADQSLLGNMEGKEARFGAADSALWAVATTAASNGSVNSMHDSFTPLGGIAPIFLMDLGEVVFGGVGSGLYGMLMYAIIAVFIAGLMVGRTPEYLGKKIEAFEMKMASLVILVPSAFVLLGTAIACVTDAGTSALGNPGAHGFTEILYAFSSASNNNGSAFGGLTASGAFYATSQGICMWFGRFVPIVCVLAIAGSLAKKKIVPATAGTLPTSGPLFGSLVVGTVILIGALTFLPALALGPVVEHLMLHVGGAS